MEDTRILMVVKANDARAAYEKALQEIGVSYHIANSFNDVQRMSTDNAYSGMLIDILTLIRSSKEEKAIAYDCINYYPSLRVKWDARQKSMNLSPLEQSFSTDTEATLSHFIEKRCKSFTARSLRRFNRKEMVLSLLLSPTAGFPDGEVMKSFTVNISRGGAFVYSTRTFAKGDAIWLRFCELPELKPVKGVICWGMEWGVCRSIPGIGIMFDGLSEEQERGIIRMAGL